MSQLDTRIPLQVPNVLAQGAQIAQTSAADQATRNALAQQVRQDQMQPLRMNALTAQAEMQSLEQTRAEQQMLGQVLDGVAGNPETWGAARQFLVGKGVFEEGELPEQLTPQAFQELSAVAFMPAEELTDYQRKLAGLNSPDPRIREASEIALNMRPGAQAPESYTLGPGQVRYEGNQVVARGPDAEPKTAPGVTGELQSAINLGLVPPETTVQQFSEMKRANSAALPNAVQIAQYMYPGDMSAQREYLENSSKRGVTVTNNMGGNQSEFGKKSAAAMADRYVGYLEGGENAQTSMNGFVEMRRLLSDPETYVGAGADYVLTGKKILQSLGVDVTGVASGENLVAQSSRAALDALSDLKGVASDTDMRVIMNTAARITDTREGAIAKVAVAERAAQYRIAVSQAAANYVKENGELDAGWFATLNQMSAQFRDDVLGVIHESGSFAGYQGQDVNEIIDSMASAGKTADEIEAFLEKNGMLPKRGLQE